MPYGGIHSGRIRPVDVSRAARKLGMRRADFVEMVDESGVMEPGMAEDYGNAYQRAKEVLGDTVPLNRLDAAADRIAAAQVQEKQQNRVLEGKQSFTLMRDELGGTWKSQEAGLDRQARADMQNARTDADKAAAEKRAGENKAMAIQHHAERLALMAKSQGAKAVIEQWKMSELAKITGFKAGQKAEAVGTRANQQDVDRYVSFLNQNVQQIMSGPLGEKDPAKAVAQAKAILEAMGERDPRGQAPATPPATPAPPAAVAPIPKGVPTPLSPAEETLVREIEAQAPQLASYISQVRNATSEEEQDAAIDALAAARAAQ